MLLVLVIVVKRLNAIALALPNRGADTEHDFELVKILTGLALRNFISPS